ncbi:winged helix-turn-helix transcriptional regulator [Nocardia sp. NBC_00511]|uniref:winged helix-turn-helix transcriptional regulator n=1 Tax=Nocardia sp. NBC_00511 TaxID=2903591 RepID=UPI0030E26135
MAQPSPAAPDWTDPTCPVARTLDLVGDRWTLLIVRDAMDNARAFGDFQQSTGIARNILTDRLRRLVERGILARTPATSGKRHIYTLTPIGADLFTVVVALRQWGERNAFAPNEQRSTLIDEQGHPLPELQPTTVTGGPATAESTTVQRNP